VECKKWGAASRLARILGYGVGHLGNIEKGRRMVGEDLARKLAAYWGMTYGELEQAALGVPSDPAEEPLPNLRATIEWCSDGYPAGFLRAYDRLAHQLTEDKRRREWLDDIDRQLRNWARGEPICPWGIDKSKLPDSGTPGLEIPPPPELPDETPSARKAEHSTIRKKPTRPVRVRVKSKGPATEVSVGEPTKVTAECVDDGSPDCCRMQENGRRALKETG
jgi:hypothetical protein